MKKLHLLLLSTTLALSAMTGVAHAYYDHWHGGGGDPHHFHEYDMGRWRGGRWVHDYYGGHFGWWWTVDGVWYAYPAPIYPYPDPYVPPGVVVSAPGQQYWYCNNPAGYYPYVPQCMVPWQPVAATAAQPVVSAPVVQAPVVAPVQSPAMSPYPATMTQQAPGAPLSERDQDDRQLNNFGTELNSISPTDYGSLKHIKDLQKRVDAFRETLFTRTYNAMDILHDTEALQKQIAARKVQIQSNNH